MPGTITGDNNQVTINITDIVPPENMATIDKNGMVGNTYSKTQFDQSFSAKSEEIDTKIENIQQMVELDFRGTLKPTDAAPTEDGTYKPAITSSDDKPSDPASTADWGKVYANAGNLRAKDGYDTLFYKNGTTWKKSETKMPNSALKTFNSADNDNPSTMKATADRYDVSLKVLHSFVSGVGSSTNIDTSNSTFEAKAYVIGAGYVANQYNKSLKLDVSGYNKMNFTGKKWLTNDSAELTQYGTVIGVTSGGDASILIQGQVSGGSITNPNQVPTDTYSNIDITAFKDLYILISNVLTTRPTLTLIEGAAPSEDSVKEYINLTASQASSPRVFNVKKYGAKGDGVTDDRVSIQSAINACFAAGGGKVLFPYPSSFYYLGTELTPYTQVYGQNSNAGMPRAQLIIPVNTDTTRLITVELVGEFKVNMADEAITSVGRSTKGFIKSGYIEGTSGNFTALLSSIYTAANTWGNKNYIHVHIENLIFRNETRSGGSDIDNKMHCINMENVTQFTFSYLKVETSSTLNTSIEPTHSIGVLMPSVNNKVQLGEGSIYVAGYKSGIKLGEHYASNRTIVLGCVNALEFPDTANSYHSASITHFNAECCRNMILMSGSNQVLNIFNYDVEHHNDGPKWFNFQYDIKKTGGSGVVNIFNAQVTKSNVGNVNEFITAGNPSYKIMTGVGMN